MRKEIKLYELHIAPIETGALKLNDPDDVCIHVCLFVCLFVCLCVLVFAYLCSCVFVHSCIRFLLYT